MTPPAHHNFPTRPTGAARVRHGGRGRSNAGADTPPDNPSSRPANAAHSTRPDGPCHANAVNNTGAQSLAEMVMACIPICTI